MTLEEYETQHLVAVISAAGVCGALLKERENRGPYVCTRHPNHVGPHQAHGEHDEVVKEWEG